LVGTLLGLTGVVPGTLTAPLAGYMFGLAMRQAQAAAIMLMVSAAVPSVVIYARSGYIDWALAVTATIGSVIGAVTGTWLTEGKTQPVIRKVIALALIAVGTHMAYLAAGEAVPAESSISVLQGLIAGFGAGLIGGIAGVSSGALLVPVVVLLYSVPQKTAQAVALAAIIPASLPLLMAYYISGGIARKTMLWLGIGGALGACVGATAAVGMSTALLGTAFSILLILMAVVIFIRR